MSNGPFGDDDFDGKDSREMIYEPETEIDKFGSMFKVTSTIVDDDIETVIDDSLFSLGICTSLVHGKEYFSVIGVDEHERTEFVNDFCLIILQLIANVYESMHDETYNQFRGHLLMDHDNPSDEAVLNKWQMVHQLCNKRAYKINFQKKFFANYYFDNKSMEEVTNDIQKYKNWKEVGKPKKPLSKEEKLARKEKREETRKHFTSLQLFWMLDNHHTCSNNI